LLQYLLQTSLPHAFPLAIKVLITYFIPDTSVAVKLLFTQAFATINRTESAPEVPVIILTTNVGHVQYNITLPTTSIISNVNRILLTLTEGTIVINRIVICSEAEG